MDLFHGHVSLIAQVASPIVSRVAVDAFPVTMLARDTKAVPLSGHRGEIKDTHQMIFLSKADIGDPTVAPIVAIDP